VLGRRLGVAARHVYSFAPHEIGLRARGGPAGSGGLVIKVGDPFLSHHQFLNMSHLASEELRQEPISNVHHVQTDPVSVQNAMAAAAEEKAMGFKAVMRIHWPAAMWSCLFSLALVMEGYDLGIVGCSKVGRRSPIRSTHSGDRAPSCNALEVSTLVGNDSSLQIGNRRSITLLALARSSVL